MTNLLPWMLKKSEIFFSDSEKTFFRICTLECAYFKVRGNMAEDHGPVVTELESVTRASRLCL